MPTHSSDDTPRVFVDASTLINFLRIKRLDLLAGVWTVTHIVEDVRAEILDANQVSVLEEALLVENIRIYQVTHLEDIQLAMKLRDDLGIGSGEAFSFLAAKRENAVLAIDDERAVKRAKRFVTGVEIVTTPEIIIQSIRKGIITIVEADVIKNEWATQHRFLLPFNSFSDIV